uniref:PiggyBac transposable element-derived protein domain-containing protein n=1 Tax=Glossina palpalis gambiensis TaxID=67801 RepID=A0A1B0C115_9MUSC
MPLTIGEIKKFIGILVIMGQVRLPELSYIGRKIQCIHAYNDEIYTEKTVNSTTKGHAHNVGRTSYTNSYYTNVLSAEELLDKSTNLCGTLKVNRRFLPIVVKLKQKRGDIKCGTKYFDVSQFRENSIDPLLDGMPTEPLNLYPKRGTANFLQKYPGTARKSRKRCHECYKSLSARRGRTIASKKSKRVTAFCRFCEGEQPLCLECFKKNHNND